MSKGTVFLLIFFAFVLLLVLVGCGDDSYDALVLDKRVATINGYQHFYVIVRPKDTTEVRKIEVNRAAFVGITIGQRCDITEDSIQRFPQHIECYDIADQDGLGLEIVE